jgi:hypothetical protein
VECEADSSVSEYKVCTQCGGSYELTKAHWHRSKDGWHAKCRKCRNKMEKRGKQKLRTKKLDEIEKGAVDYFLAAARIGGANIPHSSELLEVLMRYFGGAEGFGNAFMKQFYDAPAGGAFRTKQLQTIVQLVSANTSMGGAKKPLELMTEEELEAQYRRDVLAAALAFQSQAKLEQKDEVPNVQVVLADAIGVGGLQEVPASDGGTGAGRGDDGYGGVPLPDDVH